MQYIIFLQTQPSAPNFLLYFLVAVAVILLFVIWGLGNIMLSYARKVAEKNDISSTGKILPMIVAALIVSQFSFAQNTVDPAAANSYGGVSSATFYLLASVIVTEFLVIFFLGLQIRRLHNSLFPLPEKKKTPISISDKLAQHWRQLDKKFFTKAAEQDADVLLDHDYDGIKELDNALPPWWKYGFFITIFIGAIYLYHYHVSESGMNPEQEYAAEMQTAKLEKEAYMALAKDLVDESNVQFEQTGIETGKALYTKTCVACHGQLGEGSVGPNLTDNYWIHGGSMNDIFKTIKYGYPDKGMQSWQQQFSPKQMQQLASFIHSLKGTRPPNGKPAQGDLYQEPTPAQADTSVSAVTSVAVIQ
jgi:cytochrome c oxidase cbb3-type subunit 3